MDVCTFVLLSAIALILLSSSTTENYCSLNDININCFPCNNICTSAGQKCYHCPKQCGKLNTCKSVCHRSCRNGTCEYENDETVPTCTQGCIAGSTGKQCQEYCPNGCTECDQFTASCVVSSSTESFHKTRKECAKICDFCDVEDMLCVECGMNCQDICSCNGTIYSESATTHAEYKPSSNSPLTNWGQNSTHSTPHPHHQTDYSTEADGPTQAEGWTNKKYAVGLYGAVSSAVVIAIVLLSYKFYQRHKLRCMVANRRPRGNGSTSSSSDGSLTPYRGYTYIDDSNLKSCYSCTSANMTNPPRCPEGNYYERMENRGSVAKEDAESLSSLSTWSGTIFGNLFDINNHSDESSDQRFFEGQPKDNDSIDIVSVEENEMRTLYYLTPSVSVEQCDSVV